MVRALQRDDVSPTFPPRPSPPPDPPTPSPKIGADRIPPNRAHWEEDGGDRPPASAESFLTVACFPPRGSPGEVLYALD